MCGVVLCIAAACTVLAEHHQVQCTCLFRAAYLCDLLTGNNSCFALSHHRRDTKRQYKTVLVVDDVCVWKRICRNELFFPSFEGRGCGFVFCVFFSLVQTELPSTVRRSMCDIQSMILKDVETEAGCRLGLNFHQTGFVSENRCFRFRWSKGGPRTHSF
jgi:hypothetical protein